MFFKFVPKEVKYLDGVRARLKELMAEGMRLEYDKASIASKIADNKHRIRLLQEECIPALEKTVKDIQSVSDATGAEASPESN